MVNLIIVIPSYGVFNNERQRYKIITYLNRLYAGYTYLRKYILDFQ